MKKKTNGRQLAEMLKVSPARGIEAVIKAKLISGILSAVKKSGITHQELSIRSGLPRSAVTGILTGSLQKVTIDRVLRLVEAVGLLAEVRLKKAA